MYTSAKNCLNHIRWNRERIADLKITKRELHLHISAISGIDYAKDRVSSSPVNTLEAAAWDLLERAELIDGEILRMAEEISRIRLQLIGMKNRKYSKILLYIYDRGWSLHGLADHLGYSYDRIKHLHVDALEAFRAQFLPDLPKVDTE